jgi:hypothetical protein
MIGCIANGKQATMHFRMQSFEAALHHFGKACVLSNVLDRKTRSLQQLGRAAGRDQFDTAVVEMPGKQLEPGLIRD